MKKPALQRRAECLFRSPLIFKRSMLYVKCELKFRVWWPSVKKMRYFDNARIDYADGTMAYLFPV
jgi:hypothetical protein